MQQIAAIIAMPPFPERPNICVVGLGYVGLPLALALSNHFPVTGFDVSTDRVSALRDGRDETGEVADNVLGGADLDLSDDSADLRGQDVYIVTVPTPVDGDNRPNLSALSNACRTIGPCLRPGALVVVESTVYPGVTEEVCGPLLAEMSGLTAGEDFHLGYSPERINPGDRIHGLDNITKVVASQTDTVTDYLARLYGKVTGGKIYRATDIRTAEAAKAIENAQRDINIAFVNEVALICQRLGLSAHEVLDAAASKWNFLPFRPGLVGGHCIGVDPYYLAHKAELAGHIPDVILAGRRINDAMGGELARLIDTRLPDRADILMLGLTFKENVSDLRNSKVVDLIAGLRARGHRVQVYDPLANPAEARDYYDIELLSELPATRFGALVPAVAHRQIAELSRAAILERLRPDGGIMDIKGIWRRHAWPDGVGYWLL